jgi:hypothetical protein
MSNVVTPKWREPTRVIRMMVVPSLGACMNWESDVGMPI